MSWEHTCQSYYRFPTCPTLISHTHNMQQILTPCFSGSYSAETLSNEYSIHSRSIIRSNVTKPASDADDSVMHVLRARSPPRSAPIPLQSSSCYSSKFFQCLTRAPNPLSRSTIHRSHCGRYRATFISELRTAPFNSESSSF